MKIIKLISALLVFFLLLFLDCFSEEVITLIYLKDGSVYKGTIEQTLPDQSIKLKCGDSLYNFTNAQIDKITTQSVGDDFYEQIHFKTGNKVLGRIIEIRKDKNVRIALMDGGEIIMPQSAITGIDNVSLKPLKIKKTNYIEAGINLGTPSIINLAVGYWFGALGFRVSGMYIDRVAGIQGNLNIKLYDNTSILHNIGVVFGSLKFQEANNINNFDKTYKYCTYLGIAYNLNWGAFFMELGITTGQGNFQSPQPCLQIGYMKRFLE
jgi:hypothetical protein